MLSFRNRIESSVPRIVFLGGRTTNLAREGSAKASSIPVDTPGPLFQASTVNEEWLRAFPNLPQLLEERFYLLDQHHVDWTRKDAYDVYNRARAATLIAEPLTPSPLRGGHGPFQ